MRGQHDVLKPIALIIVMSPQIVDTFLTKKKFLFTNSTYVVSFLKLQETKAPHYVK